jgi:putative ABC transport system permease protein
MNTLWQDLRHGVRTLLKQPAFTLVAVITLALGIGANTAIFSVVNAVLLRPLPFKDSERLVMVWNKGAEAAGGDRTPLALADLLDWRAQNKSFESIGALQYATLNYTGTEDPEQVPAVNVTANFFSVLGVGVQLGRDFVPGDEQTGSPRVVLLSDQFWRSHFGSDPQTVGRTINLNGVSTTIIGVMPAQLNFPNQNVQLWRALQWQQPTRRGPYFFTGIARLKPGVPLDQARADSASMTSSFDRGNFTFNFLPINTYIVGDVKPALLALLIAVTLVLLIAAVNVANLTLVRAASRVKEISIRTALGASRARIVRRLLTESLLLAAAGGVCGILCAVWGVPILVKFAPENLPRSNQIKIDGIVLLWTALVSLLTGVIFGLVPAWQSSRLNLNEVLRDGGRGTTESAGRRRGRGILVVAELALAVILVTGAGLLIKSLWRLQQVDLGINPDRVLTMQFDLWGQRYREPGPVHEFGDRLIEQVKALPGVQAAAISNSLPPDDTEFSSDFKIEGRTPAKDLPQIAYFNRVSSDYFKALGIQMTSGRSFTSTDTTGTPRVVLINETLRRRFFPGEDPIGKRLNPNLNPGSEGEPDWTQIVGVVGDVKYNGMADEVQPAIYQPTTQEPTWGGSLVIKTSVANPLSLAAAVRNEIRKLDPDLPVTQVATMDQRLSKAVSQPRFRTTLIALFALVALLLACVGIYGVISYSVTQRTHEIGIRMALGARTGDVLRMVIRQAIVLAVVGVTIGLAASFAITRLMSSLLFGVTATDPMIFVATALVLTTTALIASYLPARRAARVDPLVALRYE